MSLIIILMAIFIERVTNFIRPIRNHFWLENYAQKIVSVLGNNAYLGIISAVLPILIVILIAHNLLDHLAYGLGGWVFDLFILLYCLGDSRLREHIEECYKLSNNDEEASRELLAEHFGVVHPDGKLNASVFMQAFYRGSLQRLFAVLFWFVILGPAGCVGYRVIQRLSINLKSTDMQGAQKFSSWLTFILDWVPARLLALSFCLVGHFTDIFSEWCASFKSKLSDTYQILYRCGHVAIKTDENPDPVVVSAQFDEAYGLVNRSLFVWLVVLALVMLF